MKLEPPEAPNPLGFNGVIGGAAGLLNALIRSRNDPVVGFSVTGGCAGFAAAEEPGLVAMFICGGAAGIPGDLATWAVLGDAARVDSSLLDISLEGGMGTLDWCVRGPEGPGRPSSASSLESAGVSNSFFDRLNLDGRGGVSGS